MVGWLSVFRAQIGSVAYWSHATFVRRLGEAAAPGGGECGPCPYFASNTLALALKPRKIVENLSQGNRMALGSSASYAIRLIDWPSQTMALTGLLSLAALSFRVRRRGQPSFSLSICRVAVLGGSPHQLNLSQSSQ